MLRAIPYFMREAVYWMAVGFVRRFMPPIAVEIVLSVCGIWCLLTPLLLWISWSQTVFLSLLGSSFLSCVIFCLVAVGAQPPPKRRKRGDVEIRRPKRLTPEAPTPPRSNSWRDSA